MEVEPTEVRYSAERKEPILTRTSLYFHTIRHMTFKQVLDRVAVRAKRKLLDVTRGGAFLYRAPYGERVLSMYTIDPLLPGLPRLISDTLDPNFGSAVRTAGEDLRKHRFSYVGEAAQYGAEVDWCDMRRTRLWRLNLHYFDAMPLWILDAVINRNGETLAQWKWIADSWTEQNPIGCFEAWNPYCLSRRIPNWILAHQLAEQGNVTEKQFSIRFLGSLYQQASYLYSNIEWDLPMNHLTANGRALLYAGIFFQGNEAKRWLERGKELLWQRLQRDVCSDGGHAERSPMYHSLVLQDCLECYVISQNVGIPWPDEVINVLRKMVEFSDAIEHPDGEIPLFNDSGMDVATKSRDLVSMGRQHLWFGGERSAAEPCAPKSFLTGALNTSDLRHAQPKGPNGTRLKKFCKTGYYVISDASQDMKMIFDCGEVGIWEVAAHGHSDVLSYELSIGGERVVVDSGTSTYASSPRRQYERGIFAHNNVSVDGRDTCEPWGDYRMARRGHPGEVQTFERDGIVIIDAGHESFLGLRGIRHRRAIISVLGCLVVFDRILGGGIHSIEARLHFHPAMRLDPLEAEGTAYRVSGRNVRLTVRPFGASVSVVADSHDGLVAWYAPRFGELLPTKLLRMETMGSLPIQLGHVFAPQNSRIECVADHDGRRIVLEAEGEGCEVLLDNHSARIRGPAEAVYTWA